MLDQVVADRDHEVGVLEPGHLVVAGLEPDRAERLGILVVDEPLGHERLGDRNSGVVDERPQRPAGVAADRAVAGERQRVAGRVDQVGGALELPAARLGLDGGVAGERRGVERALHHVLG